MEVRLKIEKLKAEKADLTNEIKKQDDFINHQDEEYKNLFISNEDEKKEIDRLIVEEDRLQEELNKKNLENNKLNEDIIQLKAKLYDLSCKQG